MTAATEVLVEQPYCYVSPGVSLDAPDRTCPYIRHFMIDGGIVAVENSRLTPPELRALVLGAAGYTGEEAGHKAGTNEDNMKNHLKFVFQKMAANGKSQAIRESFDSGEFTVVQPIETFYPLTNQHVNILRLAAEGLTEAAISKRMDLSINTVRVHGKNLRARMAGRDVPPPPTMAAAVLRAYIRQLLLPA
jgi:DNA-binding CsgD family transcriptional regulator